MSCAGTLMRLGGIARQVRLDVDQECECLSPVLVGRDAVGQMGLPLKPFGLPVKGFVDLIVLATTQLCSYDAPCSWPIKVAFCEAMRLGEVARLLEPTRDG